MPWFRFLGEQIQQINIFEIFLTVERAVISKTILSPGLIIPTFGFTI